MKHLALFFALLLVGSLAFSQNDNLKGVVTFESEYGTFPDVGAKIYIEKVLDTTLMYNTKLDLFDKVKSSKSLLIMIGKNKDYEKDKNRCIETLKKNNAYEKNDFKTFLSETHIELMNKTVIFDKKSTVVLTVDGNGNYSTALPLGIYRVIIVSKKAIDLNVVEVKGKIYVGYVAIKKDKQGIESNNFTLKTSKLE